MKLVAESASLVHQDDILLPLCPVAIVEVLHCLRVDKSVHTPGHAPTWLLLRQHRACPFSWSPVPSSRGWLQKRCLFPRGSTLSVEGLHLPCTHNQTEVEAQLHRFVTVLDVVNRVLEIRRAGIGSSTSSSTCGPSDFITQSSCRQGRNHRPLDKGQTLFLVQLCVATFRTDLVRQCLHEDHSSTPAERDGQETELVSALHTRGKVL